MIKDDRFYSHNGILIGNNGRVMGIKFDPYNPLDLPPNIIRVRTSDGNPPTKKLNTTYETATLVPGTNDVYDVYKSGTSLFEVLYGSSNVVEVIGANTSNITDMSVMFLDCTELTSVALFDTSNVTNMQLMFDGCHSLTSVPLFDTSNVTNMHDTFMGCRSLTTVPLFNTSNVTIMSNMFYKCYSLTSVPLLDTSNVTDMSHMFAYCSSLTTVPLFNTFKVSDIGYMFLDCGNVQSGALALYQQASTQTTIPHYHDLVFKNCGVNTVTGTAELAQIPYSWGGTMPE